ncbi:type II CRISPR RNA-guided endonuclease Cas9 [Lactobacillus sp. UCMA15818]|uniref:type II CRISPR RNA-guided endonuclease Cas9 n=1 Tax=Lactobacillus sp. UCMA15818 TaxID=2583394 RepID=UPI0025AF711E|nr:type II CRISPR RNA-guided endonuclease Cas9 [Lactobacillus sp. UCMA15818]MDN2453388.1 type II CRISPR RNA-guided endonuclease Cas9 [Lactobacillus sp. UCMA15818]
MAKYSVGLDIGIASVGWSIVDAEKKEIVDLGSRIFSSGNAAANQERRSFRGTRRLIRRRKNRLADVMNFLGEKNFVDTKVVDRSGHTHYEISVNNTEVPYKTRVKGLSERLTKQELVIALYHIVKHRGISYDLGDLEDDGTSGVTDYKASININRQLLTKETIGQIQLERLNEFGKVRGQVKKDENVTLLNVFPSSAYVKEATQILTKQREFYPEITDDFIAKFMTFITRKRDYFVGPGNEKSRTDYGIYKKDGRTLDNLFDELIGTDKTNGEKRASASSVTAQIYNMLNDLNNLTVPNTEDGKLTTQTKKEILETAKITNGLFGITQICKIIGCKKDDIKGFRIEKAEKPIMHTLSGYRKFRKELAKVNIEANDLDINLVNRVADVLTLNTEKAEIRKQLEKSNVVNIPNEIKEIIINKNKEFLVDGRATWHSFSYKTLNLLIPELLNTSEEQMTILTRLGLVKPNNEKYKGLKNIPARRITEDIYNPVVAKATREAVNVFNAITKQIGRNNIKDVVIELPREDNEADIKKGIVKRQKQNEVEKEAADALVKQQMTISDSALVAQYHKIRGLSQKVRYWYQQDTVCPYCGKKIEAVQLINNNDSFEVDHVVPISVSFDDSQNNKALVHSQCNQAKGKQTPLGWLNNGGGFGQNKTEYIARVRANKNYAKNKIDNLLNDADLNDISTQRGFIQRNLNDTRYASRIVLDELYSFFKSNNLPTKVKVVRGKWTSQMRKKWNGVGGLKKTRDTYHHHAIDASIIASFPLLKVFDKAVKLIDIDRETGEILQDKEAIKIAQEAKLLEKIAVIQNGKFEELIDELYDFPLFKQVELANDITNPENPVKFSHHVDKKANRTVANQTIYGTRIKEKEINKRGKMEKKQERYILGTIKNIYDIASFTSFKKLYDKMSKNGDIKFLMQKNDPKTWEKLVDVLNSYPDSEEVTQVDGKVKRVTVSPFELYRRENGFITKYAKHNDGPKVVSIRYYDSKIGSHIDITPKNAKNNVVLQSLKPWRTDVYFNSETQQYELLGLKYSDLKFTNGTYGITDDAYEKLKNSVSEDGETAWKPIGKNSEFRFSLYRNNRVRVVDEKGESIELLFASRTTSNEGYVELKPIHKAKFDSKEEVGFYGQMAPSGQFVKKMARAEYKLYKVNTDVLGNLYYVTKESDKPKLNL